MTDQKKNILITGASGFLGRYIIDYLLPNPLYNIIALGFNNSLSQEGLKFYSCDLTDIFQLESYVKEADIVIHAAGYISFERSDYEKLMNVNARGTENLVNLCLEHQVEKLVYVSSIAAFPVDESSGIVTESHRFKDRKFTTEYGLSKYIGESHVWRAYAEGLNTCILNPSLIIGEGDWSKGTPSFFPTIANGLKYYPTGSTGIVYAGDVANFIKLIIDHEPEHNQYVLSAENMSFKELFSLIALSVGQKSPHIPIKGQFKWFAFLIDRVRKYLFGKYGYLSRQNLRTISGSRDYDHTLSLTLRDFNYHSISDVVQTIGQSYLQYVKEK